MKKFLGFVSIALVIGIAFFFLIPDASSKAPDTILVFDNGIAYFTDYNGFDSGKTPAATNTSGTASTPSANNAQSTPSATTPAAPYQNTLQNTSLLPYYNSLNSEDKEIYTILYDTAAGFVETPVEIGRYSTEKQREDVFDRLPEIIRNLKYEHGEMFWLNWFSADYDTSPDGEHILYVTLTYHVSKTKHFTMKAEYERIQSQIINSAKGLPTTYDKILYVYDYIIGNARYDYDLSEDKKDYPLGYTSYACLVEGVTVCAGYVSAFTPIMRALGIECGFERGDPANPANNSDAAGHVWSYCNIDGEYYYFDLTWDDNWDEKDPNPPIKSSHNYFGITGEELDLTHGKYIVSNSFAPKCNGTKYNYHRYNNINIESYSYDKLKTIVENSASKPYIDIRFDNAKDLDKAKKALFTDKKLYEILPDINGSVYYESSAGLHLQILLE